MTAGGVPPATYPVLVLSGEGGGVPYPDLGTPSPPEGTSHLELETGVPLSPRC